MALRTKNVPQRGQRLPSGQQFVAMRAANVIKNLLHYMLRVVPQGVNT